MKRFHESWFDDAAGPLVRPFGLAKGRTTGARSDLDVASMVVAADRSARLPVEREYLDIVRACRHQTSIAELAAKLRLPMLLAKILVGDLVDRGHLLCRAGSSAGADASRHDVDLLRTVLSGIRKPLNQRRSASGRR